MTWIHEMFNMKNYVKVICTRLFSTGPNFNLSRSI